MKVEFVGAARTVTGSSYIVKNEHFTIMVDCGMFQGRRELRERNYLNLIYAPQEIQALLVTHAHIDHSGLIPKLVKEGYQNPIYVTRPTAQLLTVMLPDSAHIQEMDSEWINKRNKKLGREIVDPLYTQDDAIKALEYIAPKEYEETFEVVPGVRARFREAGHILGSSFLELWVEEDGKTTKLVFSGDIGPTEQAIIRNAEIVDDADYLFIESTYGDRLHKSRPDTFEEFKQIINETHNKKGNIIIPSFAVERTQEIIYILAQLFKEGAIPRMKVYIDSPLAIAATEIFQNSEQYYDEEARAILEAGENPLDFPELHFVRTTQESKELVKKARGAIILSASGMCTAGRIKFHLQNNLYRPESSVIFVGYQAEGTLGRSLVDGAKRVRVYGEDVAVKAKIYTLGGFSGHADRDGLLQWMGHIKNEKLKVFVVHGEEKAAVHFSESVKDKFGYETYVPHWGEIIDLATMSGQYAAYGEQPRAVEELEDMHMVEIQRLLALFEEKYRRVKNKGNNYELQKTLDDIEDLKEMIKMISEEI